MKYKKIIDIQNKKIQTATAITSFIFAFLCFLLFISQSYSLLFIDDLNEKSNLELDNITTTNQTPFMPHAPPKNDFFRGLAMQSPLLLFTSFFGLCINILTGIIILSNLDKKEKKKILNNFYNKTLLPEEQKIIKIIENNNGEITQSELVKESNLSKVKISRIIKKLESNEIIKKYNYGLTNKIIINSDFLNSK